MPQQDIFPLPVSENKQIEDKLFLLHLIEKIDLPVSNGQVTQFVQSQGVMNYYAVQNYLNELVDAGYLEKSTDNKSTRYTITEDGVIALESFSKHIAPNLKNMINKYVAENLMRIKQEFETTSSHFFDYDNNEYIVKCNAYEDEIMLMEISLSVVSRDQALAACNNWKNNAPRIYGKILDHMVNGVPEEEQEEI